MLNFAREKRKPMEAVHLRLPPAIREKARSVATEQSTDEIKVKEADVYRSIIENFFDGSDTKCLQISKHNASGE